MAKAIQIDSKDNVATTTSEVYAGEAVDVISSEGVVMLSPAVTEDIPFGHKLAIQGIPAGGSIVKYGEVIGVAKQPIRTGAWVNTHNVGSARMPTRGKETGVLE